MWPCAITDLARRARSPRCMRRVCVRREGRRAARARGKLAMQAQQPPGPPGSAASATTAAAAVIVAEGQPPSSENWESSQRQQRQQQDKPRAAHIQVELDVRLLKAAAVGSLEGVKAAHAEGGDVAAIGLNGGLPLHFAAKGGHTWVCSYLLRHGAEVDATTAHEAGGFTALWVASQFGRADIIADLVKAGAAVDRQAVDGSTALWIAAAKGNDAVQTLLESGAAVHLCDRKGTSPLLVAAKFGQKAAVEALLAAGADYEQVSDMGLGPLDAALENGHSDVVRTLFAAARGKRDWALTEMRQRECDIDALNMQITQRKNANTYVNNTSSPSICEFSRLDCMLQVQKKCSRSDINCRRGLRR